MTTLVLATTQTGAGWILLGVALVALLECSVGLGAILPSETVVISAAATAANGRVSVWAVFVVAWLCAAAGDNVGFWIGHRWGPRLIERFGARLRLTPERIKQGDDFVARWGALGVAAGRLIPAVRILVMPTAGAAKLPWKRFVLADLVGAGAWAALHVTVGYLVGLGIEQAEGRVVGSFVVVLALVALVGWLVYRHHTRTSREPAPTDRTDDGHVGTGGSIG